MTRTVLNVIFTVVAVFGTAQGAVDIPGLTTILEQPLTVPQRDLVATSLIITYPPSGEGVPPHTHPGTVTGYVLEGELLFQVNEEAPRIIRAGEPFYEKVGDVHVWGANASNRTTVKFLATLMGIPGEPILTVVEGYQRESYADALRKAQRPREPGTRSSEKEELKE